MTGLQVRIQAQIPSERRDYRALLENIAGNVVNGRVFSPNIVVGSPTNAAVTLTAFTLTAKTTGSDWNDARIYVQNTGAALSVQYNPDYDPSPATLHRGKYIIVSFAFGVTTYGELETLISAITPFNASNNGVGGMEPGDVIPESDYGIETTPTSGGEDVLCFPEGKKDFMRVIQNCGTNAVKLLYSNSGHASATQFHQILRGCNVQDDGNGGVVQVVVPTRVTAIGADGNAVRLAITRIESPEAL